MIVANWLRSRPAWCADNIGITLHEGMPYVMGLAFYAREAAVVNQLVNDAAVIRLSPNTDFRFEISRLMAETADFV